MSDAQKSGKPKLNAINKALGAKNKDKLKQALRDNLKRRKLAAVKDSKGGDSEC